MDNLPSSPQSPSGDSRPAPLPAYFGLASERSVGDNVGQLFEQLVQVTSWGALAYFLAMAVFAPEPMRLATALFIALSGPITRLLLRHGQPRRAYAAYLWLVWATVCYQSAYRSGLLNTSLHACAVLILLTGWMLGTRHALWLWMASMGWICVLLLNSFAQWWAPMPLPPTPVQWLSLVGVWSVGFFVIRLILNLNQQRVKEVEMLNAALLEKIQAIDAQERASRLNELQVLQILTASPLPITVAGFVSGTYVDVNPAWERTFGHQKQDVLGKTSIDLGFWHDMQERQGWIDQFNRDGRVSDHEATFKMVDGSNRTFLLSSERFRYGQEDCVLTMSVDLTERKRLESELRELNAQLEQRVAERTRAVDQSNRELLHTMETLQRAQDELVQSEKLASLGSLVAGVAHELNTPLGNALVTTSAMQERAQETLQVIASGQLKKSTLESFLHHMVEGTTLSQRSLERAVDLIASFKQVAVDQVSERRRTFDVAQTLDEVLDTLRPNIRRSKIALRLNLEPNLTLDGFPGPLGQVIINIVMNAVTHAFDGRETGMVEVLCQPFQGQGGVRIRITDDGVGIDPDHLTQVFDPFFTTRLGQGGSGLGLAISRRIVTKILGGQISVQSTLGQGTRFELLLPRVAPNVVN